MLSTLNTLNQTQCVSCCATCTAEYVENEFDNSRDDIVEQHKDLLKLANNYILDHLKELVEVRLSRSVTRLNVAQIKNFAETYNSVNK
ncbi:hypothetical protein RclHR1_03320001 [Rhizophagus clarus]|uniref:Uncharacterized protein n=1 Tax=Rhizophagus clarus TaxID=94130 RepID=A0A2Z6R931_9GLOM|nr:hypothetical protein RclHR1_03320001 [Rhizophagus clarus]